jgi:hypothetical protein
MQAHRYHDHCDGQHTRFRTSISVASRLTLDLATPSLL